MKLEFRRTERAGDIAAEYKRNKYVTPGKFPSCPAGGWDKGQEEKYLALLALGENPLSDDVDRVLGRKGFTWNQCGECKEYVDCIVSIGEEPDWETRTAYVCRSCLVKAIELIDSGAAAHANHLAT